MVGSEASGFSPLPFLGEDGHTRCGTVFAVWK